MKTDREFHDFAAKHAPELAEKMTKLCGQVIAKGLTGILEEVCRIQQELEQTKRNRDMWKGQCERQAEALTEAHKNARRYLHMRDLAIEKTGMPGQPCIAMPNGMQSGYYLTEETADHAVDTSIEMTGRRAAASIGEKP